MDNFFYLFLSTYLLRLTVEPIIVYDLLTIIERF